MAWLSLPLFFRPRTLPFVKLAFLAVAAGLLLLGGLLVAGLFSPSLDPYAELQHALGAPRQNVAKLWALAARADGAGWLARITLAEIARQEGDPQTSVALLTEALALRESAEARKTLARAWEELGRPNEALAEWKRLLPAEEAVQALVRLEKDQLAVGQTLIAARAYAQALLVLSGIPGAEAALLRARALRGLGKDAEAAAEFARYLKAHPNDPVAQVEYGQALERMGETDRAVAAYRAAGALGLYRLGLLLENLGRAEEALAAYRLSSEPEARWRAARLLEERGRAAEALPLYRELAQGQSRVADDAALRAHLLSARAGDWANATAMKRLLPPAFLLLLGDPVPSLSFAPDPPPMTPPAVRLAADLVRRFPKEGATWAKIELDIALRRASAPETLAMAEWFAQQGAWRQAYALGVRVLPELPCPRAYRLAYPRAWEESVRKWAEAYGVDPLLVWAVMREESGFLPTAVSSANARGLMQLLPSTARWIAEEKLRIPYRVDLLFDPDYNIRLGTWYLRHLLDQFRGNVAWAVAAYNAGPGNVRRWTAQGVAQDADLPAHLRAVETREYLVKVLNSWLIYRELHGK